MPTNFDTTFTTGHVIQATHILQAFEPIERLETGESFFGEDAGGGDPSAYVISLDPPPPDPLPAGFMAHFKAGSTNTGAATLQLNGLDPVDLVGPVNEALQAGTIQTGQMVAALFDGTRFQLVGATPPLELDDLADVDTSGASSGDVLSFDGSDWVPASVAGAGTTLDSLLDVAAGSPMAGEVLTFDGSVWVPALPATLQAVVVKTSAQTGFSTNAWTQVTGWTERLDSGGNFASDQFTSGISGRIDITGSLFLGTPGGGSSDSHVAVGLWKDGSLLTDSVSLHFISAGQFVTAALHYSEATTSGEVYNLRVCWLDSTANTTVGAYGTYTSPNPDVNAVSMLKFHVS